MCIHVSEILLWHDSHGIYSYIMSGNGIRTDLKCSKTHGSCPSPWFCTSHEELKGAPLSCKPYPSTERGVVCVMRRSVPILFPGILRILAIPLMSMPDSVRLKTLKTGYLLTDYEGKEVYQLGFQVCRP